LDCAWNKPSQHEQYAEKTEQGLVVFAQKFEHVNSPSGKRKNPRVFGDQIGNQRPEGSNISDKTQ
jgi:hypothetical protein